MKCSYLLNKSYKYDEKGSIALASIEIVGVVGSIVPILINVGWFIYFKFRKKK